MDYSRFVASETTTVSSERVDILERVKINRKSLKMETKVVKITVTFYANVVGLYAESINISCI